MARKNQAEGASRILLEPHIRDLVDQIQSVTQTKSPSQAVALLVSRYHRHLLSTWVVEPHQCGTVPDRIRPDILSDEFTFSEAIEGL